MSEFPPCPSCAEEITYPDRDHYVCATCGHEWPLDGSEEVTEESKPKFRDANSTPLASRNLNLLSSVTRSEEHTSELQSRPHLVCRLLLEKKNYPCHHLVT